MSRVVITLPAHNEEATVVDVIQSIVAVMEQVVILHSEIVEAVRKGSPERAFERMSEHWKRMREIWEA